jgi:N-methylhydantoinase B
MGLRRDIQIIDHISTFASHGDRQHFPPWGLFGGQPGKTGKFVINPGKPGERVLPSGKNSDIVLQSGDILSVQTPGSGGYGPPAERDRELIFSDKINGKVSSA